MFQEEQTHSRANAASAAAAKSSKTAEGKELKRKDVGGEIGSGSGEATSSKGAAKKAKIAPVPGQTTLAFGVAKAKAKVKKAEQ